jgi:hypothetical protein
MRGKGFVENDASPDEIERGKKMVLAFRPKFERLHQSVSGLWA